jgi:hypothetical protein
MVSIDGLVLSRLDVQVRIFLVLGEGLQSLK